MLNKVYGNFPSVKWMIQFIQLKFMLVLFQSWICTLLNNSMFWFLRVLLSFLDTDVQYLSPIYADYQTGIFFTSVYYVIDNDNQTPFYNFFSLPPPYAMENKTKIPWGSFMKQSNKVSHQIQSDKMAKSRDLFKLFTILPIKIKKIWWNTDIEAIKHLRCHLCPR